MRKGHAVISKLQAFRQAAIDQILHTIEGWFKTAKHRFGLNRFGQGTLIGVYRWLVLSMIAYLLAHWAYL